MLTESADEIRLPEYLYKSCVRYLVVRFGTDSEFAEHMNTKRQSFVRPIPLPYCDKPYVHDSYNRLARKWTARQYYVEHTRVFCKFSLPLLLVAAE